MPSPSTSADERGAFAILYALLAVFLIGIGALAVDVGNAVARRERAQSQADQAALAGAAQVQSAPPTSGKPSWPQDSALLTAIADSMSSNAPRDDGGGHCVDSDGDGKCVEPAELIDGDPDNGEVSYLGGSLRVVSPRARANFATGQIIQESSWTEVQGTAAVSVFSPDISVMPAFAVAGCDFGRQTLTDPANGQVDNPTPTLSFSSDDSGAQLSSMTPSEVPVATVAPSPLPRVEVTGQSFRNVTDIGFFRADGSAPRTSPAEWVATDADPATSGFDSPRKGGAQNDPYVLSAAIPAQVLATEELWYVRTFSGKTDAAPSAWSDDANSLPLRVGDPVLECSAGSSDGNFGALRLDRTDVQPGLDVAMNLAQSLQKPLSLTVHPEADQSGLCTAGTNGAVETAKDVLQRGTNCVATDPGLPVNSATQGLITGVKEGSLARPGRLVGDNTPYCDTKANQPAERLISLPGKDAIQINNDTLSCFLTSGSLADITTASYSGGSRLDEAILDSPRLYYVPVLGVDPGKGTSNTYSVVDFRPAFITDETISSSTVGPGTQTVDNGLVMSGDRLTTIKVVFFNADALPRPEDASVMDFLGVGIPITRLTD